jgi:hypothetical protein
MYVCVCVCVCVYVDLSSSLHIKIIRNHIFDITRVLKK